jgi:His-Xaa-Ser system radical SAM maturase HxsC
MLLRIKGKPHKIDSYLIGRVTRSQKNIGPDSIFILESLLESDLSEDPQCILTTLGNEILGDGSFVYDLKSLDHLEEGDIVGIGVDGNINTLYRVNSMHNTLLATERCNSNCLMCSQPPKDRDDIPMLYSIHSKLIPMIPKECIQLGISGGEPTLMGELFFDLLNQTKIHLPKTEIHVLTNGRTFAWNEYAEKLNDLLHRKVMLGIPLYSDDYLTHDHIVQAENAFYQTIQGIHNLARYNIRIEIRVVLHKLSVKRLKQLARYIYHNLPFVEHIAFMGLEYTGYTPYNIDKLWIDPFDYQQELSDAVLFLARKGMRVSIYNSTLCTLPESLWEFSRKSISDWKNEYLDECEKCNKLDECGGLFRWNLKKHSEYIKPFV